MVAVRVKIGVILVVETWLNNALLEALERQADAVFLVGFGPRRQRSRLEQGLGRRLFAGGSRRDLHSRAYVRLLLRTMRAMRSAGIDYCLCLHGGSAVVESIAPLLERIHKAPDTDLIEARSDRPSGSRDRFGRYSFGLSWLDALGNALLSKLPTRRFQALGFRFGHDAWGLSAKSLDYVLDSAKAAYFYRQCRFSVDPKHFYFHTLARCASGREEGNSPERYVSEDYQRYRQAYADHAAALCAQGPGLFYPGGPRAALLRAAEGEQPLEGSPSPYRPYPSSRPPLCWGQTARWGRLTTCREPYFALFFLPQAPPTALIRALNQEPAILCHGNIYAPDALAYAEPEHICPRYEPDQLVLRDYNHATFLYDLIYFYRGKRFGFAVDMTRNQDFNKFWILPACIPLFCLPGNLAAALRLTIRPGDGGLSVRPDLEVRASGGLLSGTPELEALLRLLRTDSFQGPPPLLVDLDQLAAPEAFSALKAHILSPLPGAGAAG